MINLKVDIVHIGATNVEDFFFKMRYRKLLVPFRKHVLKFEYQQVIN